MTENNPAPSSLSPPLIEALVSFHKTVPAINKTANAQYGKFADLETVLSTVTPHLIKNGLVISQAFEPSEGLEPILVTRLLHVSGAELVSRLPMIIGKGRNPLHDFGGSCTYSRRYALLALLGLTADMDVDGDFADDKPAESKPAAKPAAKKTRGPDDALEKDEYVTCLSEIQSYPKMQDCVKDFRAAFNLPSTAKLSETFTMVKHQQWLNANASKYV
tara:strand:- start:2528 stop:3181 length:654 start_codon:yes stop_codon:yes gene_type:complete